MNTLYIWDAWGLNVLSRSPYIPNKLILPYLWDNIGEAPF